jgi:hypothetical protein
MCLVSYVILQVCVKDEVTHKDVYGKSPKDYEAAERRRAEQAAAEKDGAAQRGGGGESGDV